MIDITCIVGYSMLRKMFNYYNPVVNEVNDVNVCGG